MATVTGLTAARMLAIEAASIVSGAIGGDNHFRLTSHDGTVIDAGAFSQATTALAGFMKTASIGQVDTGTDATVAVTPASLVDVVGRIATLENAPTKVVSGITEASVITAYALGVSIQNNTTGSLWSLNGGLGTSVTIKATTTQGEQFFYTPTGGTQTPQIWMRTYHLTNGGGGWTAWQICPTLATLVAGSFTQATVFTSYPPGESRLYYTSGGTGWDFSGKAAEVRTYTNGTDFAKQTYIRHNGGTTYTSGLQGGTEQWTRTANSASGWTDWKKLKLDAKLPDPVQMISAVATTITATAWAVHPATAYSTQTLVLPYDAVVQVEYKEWVSITYVATSSIRVGVAHNTDSPDAAFGGTWGNVLFASTNGNINAGGQQNMSWTGKLAAGTHTFQIQAYKTGTGVATGSYGIFNLSVLRWAE